MDPCEGTDCLNGGRCVTDVEADSNGLYDPSALNAATCDCDCGFTGGSCESGKFNTAVLVNPLQWLSKCPELIESCHNHNLVESTRLLSF